jgi:hypothetical protein
MVIAEDAAAGAEYEPRVPPDQQLERPGIPVFGKPAEQLSIRRAGNVRPERGDHG